MSLFEEQAEDRDLEVQGARLIGDLGHRIVFGEPLQRAGGELYSVPSHRLAAWKEFMPAPPRILQGYFQGTPRLPQGSRRPPAAPFGATAIPVDFLASRVPGRGERLPEVLQRKLEDMFRSDFSDVRIHTAPEARALGALALTISQDVYFAPGQYSPFTAHGLRLLGHELTHVVQQKQGRVRNPFGEGLAIVHHPGLEAEAERMGGLAAASIPPLLAKLGPGRARALAWPPPARDRVAQMAKKKVFSFDPRVDDIATGYFGEGKRSIPKKELQEPFESFMPVQPGPSKLFLTRNVKRVLFRTDVGELLQFLTIQFSQGGQGHIGCGMRKNDAKLYISSSGNVSGETEEAIEEWVKGLWIGEKLSKHGKTFHLTGGFVLPKSVVVCKHYGSNQTSNHAECRIIKVWGKGGAEDSGAIRTTGPACGDCAYLMDLEKISYGMTTGKRSKAAGWRHPFTGDFYGPQTSFLDEGKEHYHPGKSYIKGSKRGGKKDY